MVWFRRFKGRVSINKSMNGSFSIWDELKFSESSIWFAWGSCPEHIFHLGACVFQCNSMAHLEMIARFLGSVMMFPNLSKRRTRQLEFLFCWPRWWQRARCFWGVCTAKACDNVNQNISPIFIVFFSSMVGPFSWIHSPRNWCPKKSRSSSFSQTISRFFPLDFNRGGTIPQQPSDASNHPRGVKNKMRSCDVKVFCVVFKFFGCEDRTDEVVSEIFGLFTLILGEDPIYFSDGWLNHQVEDRDWQFSAALQIVWVKSVFSGAFFAEIIDLFL